MSVLWLPIAGLSHAYIQEGTSHGHDHGSNARARERASMPKTTMKTSYHHNREHGLHYRALIVYLMLSASLRCLQKRSI